MGARANKKKKEMAGVNLTNCLDPNYGKGFPMVKEKCGTLLLKQVDQYGNPDQCSNPALLNAHPRLKHACNNGGSGGGGGGLPGLDMDFSLAEGGGHGGVMHIAMMTLPVIGFGAVGLGVAFLINKKKDFGAKGLIGGAIIGTILGVLAPVVYRKVASPTASADGYSYAAGSVYGNYIAKQKILLWVERPDHKGGMYSHYNRAINVGEKFAIDSQTDGYYHIKGNPGAGLFIKAGDISKATKQ